MGCLRGLSVSKTRDQINNHTFFLYLILKGRNQLYACNMTHFLNRATSVLPYPRGWCEACHKATEAITL